MFIIIIVNNEIVDNIWNVILNIVIVVNVVSTYNSELWKVFIYLTQVSRLPWIQCPVSRLPWIQCPAAKLPWIECPSYPGFSVLSPSYPGFSVDYPGYLGFIVLSTGYPWINVLPPVFIWNEYPASSFIIFCMLFPVLSWYESLTSRFRQW